jgi:pyrimidine deaminase RibD-like protein
MRDFADAHPDLFDHKAIAEASGYIPTRAQANDPRFKTALTVDVHPGQTGKEANKMALKTDAQGKPGLLIKSANMIGEAAKSKSYGYGSTPLSQVPGEREDELGNQEATGPEFPPQMPAGTTKVDVSDLTDWYRLGMDISDLDDADPEDYNQGPPQTVVVFPSDEAEQGYLKQFKRLGLKTHDMDPDVEGGEDTTGKHLREALAEEFELFEEQDLFEIKMTGKNLASLAKDIKGARVGLEFEMIVPNVSNDEDNDQEPDYDQDERVRDIDDAVNFFDDGDFNGRNEIRRLRERMESDYFDWQSEKISERWHSDQGLEFFAEYLDREDPFDAEDAEMEARNELQTQYGDELSVEEFEKMLFALVDEKRQNYNQEQWDEQGRNFDNAEEEFFDEQRDDVSESEWLSDQNIRFASDVESNYGDVTWPYYTSNSDSEGDIESVALDFMNAMGMDTVAISSSYHGSYKKWNGSNWVGIGSNKPDDCFTIEPDGSLEGDDSSDTGLEFVSPPIPLEDIGTVMSKVQNWAGNYGAYTGDRNKTSIHTNISIPGYDLDKLDYLKAALLLGDEYVLREFDRIGNTYAAPAIEKVKQLVKQNPDKAKTLLDKMKSQLNAEASKLIHSGQTNKFTSINTKDNRVEFRSPGGDYLSIIADNPQKMVDTINRMVVTLDAAMDPDKYKEEYQKKLYKMLTGQESGREAQTGAKREMKKDDKDLLNIFSRYAAGELPRAALKSFVRQAQLERSVAKGKETAQAPAEQGNWGIWINANDRFVNQPGSYARGETPPLYRFPTREAAEQWIEQQRAARPNMRADIEVREIAPAEPVPGSTLDLQRQRAAQAHPSEFELYRISDGRAVTAPAGNPIVFRATGPEDAESKIARYAADFNLGAPQLYAVRSVLEVPAQQPQGVDTSVDYELYNRNTGEVIDTFPARNDDEAITRLSDYINFGAGQSNPDNFDVRRGPGVTNTASNARSNLIPHGPGPWEVASMSNNQVYFNPEHTNRGAAETEARTWLTQNGYNPAEFVVRTREGVPQTNDAAQGGIVDVAGDNWSADFERSMQQSAQAAQTLTRPGQGQQTFTGQWKVVDGSGSEVYRFGGIGNSQHDANSLAARWLRSQGIVDSSAYEVYPVMSESLTEGNQLRLRDFVVTISPHALEQCYNRDIDANQVDNILKNISQAKSSIMGQPDNAPFIIHDGQGTALGIRRLAGQQLKLATVYNVPENFVKGKYPTFQVDINQPLAESASDYELHNRPKLDRVLAQCCRMVVKGQQRDSKKFGQVAACVIDPDNQMVYGINLPGPDGTRRHAERVAIDKYKKTHGEIPQGSIVVTTCSPCNSSMDERTGESCKDLLNSVGIHKVYAGYQDPTQHDDRDADFRVYITHNDRLWSECQLFAQTFLGTEELAENFADGKHPEDKGDSKRYCVPTKASVSTLRKVAKQGGRKGQLAHWAANMKAGRAKAKRNK